MFLYYRPDFLTGINSQVKRSGGRGGGAERRSSGGGGGRARGLEVPRAVSGGHAQSRSGSLSFVVGARLRILSVPPTEGTLAVAPLYCPLRTVPPQPTAAQIGGSPHPWPDRRQIWTTHAATRSQHVHSAATVTNWPSQSDIGPVTELQSISASTPPLNRQIVASRPPPLNERDEGRPHCLSNATQHTPPCPTPVPCHWEAFPLRSSNVHPPVSGRSFQQPGLGPDIDCGARCVAGPPCRRARAFRAHQGRLARSQARVVVVCS